MADQRPDQIPLIPMTQEEYIAKGRELAALVRSAARMELEHAAARKEMGEEKAMLTLQIRTVAKALHEQGLREP